MMSIFSNVKDAVRKYLRLPSIEADVKAFNEAMVDADINAAKVQALLHNEQLRFSGMLRELENAIIAANAKLENERRRREGAEKQLTVEIAMLTNKINRIEGLVDQRNGSTGNHKEQ